MRDLLSVELPGAKRARISHSTRDDGDLSPSTTEPTVLAARRRAAVPIGRWHTVHQVHGKAVVVVGNDAGISDGRRAAAGRPQADALATRALGQVLAVHSGDCVPVGLIHEAGSVAVAHAGWKGLRAGVLQSAVQALRTLVEDSRGLGIVHAAIGPHVHVDRYEFGVADLDELASQFGAEIVGVTNDGKPALDLTIATRHELERLGVAVDVVSPDCTATLADQYWSYRARSENGRIAMVGWIEST